MPKMLGYARISTSAGQDLQSQKAVLSRAGAVVVFTDVGDGTRLAGRDQLETAIGLLEAGDVLIGLNPDRLARDTADLLTIAKRVVEQGAVLQILEPRITFDGTDLMAEVLLTVFGMAGKIEKHFIRSRQKRGIEAAKARGIYKGRPPKLDQHAIVSLKSQGVGATAIAKQLGVGRASVYRALNKA